MKSKIITTRKILNLYLVKAFLVIAALLSFGGCEKDLDPGIPDSQLTDVSVFADVATVNAAMAHIYATLWDKSPVIGNSNGLGALLGLYADELDYYRSGAETDAAFFNHTVIPPNSGVANLWNDSYAIIYASNAVIEGLEKSELQPEIKAPFLGEALFVRAYMHFYLTHLFGNIPYVKTTDYTVNASVGRMTQEQIYAALEMDLIEAASLLPEVDDSGEKIRATKGAATALLARQYLYAGEWNKALLQSANVIENGNYAWQPDLDMVFNKESSATILQLKPVFEGTPTKEAETFVFETGPPYIYALSDQFIMGFEEGDMRREIWTNEVTEGSQSWFHPYKYKQNTPSGSSTEYSILFRLAEQYLIHAEASIQLGNLEAAKNSIDKIRERAGLDATTATTPEELLDEVIMQRKYELFTEQGHRWFDLKRTDKAREVLQPIKEEWRDTDLLLPLPERELLLNPALKPQNPGY